MDGKSKMMLGSGCDAQHGVMLILFENCRASIRMPAPGQRHRHCPRKATMKSHLPHKTSHLGSNTQLDEVRPLEYFMASPERPCKSPPHSAWLLQPNEGAPD